MSRGYSGKSNSISFSVLAVSGEVFSISSRYISAKLTSLGGIIVSRNI
jgi:hypothetical protein